MPSFLSTFCKLNGSYGNIYLHYFIKKIPNFQFTNINFRTYSVSSGHSLRKLPSISPELFSNVTQTKISRLRFHQSSFEKISFRLNRFLKASLRTCMYQQTLYTTTCMPTRKRISIQITMLLHFVVLSFTLHITFRKCYSISRSLPLKFINFSNYISV